MTQITNPSKVNAVLLAAGLLLGGPICSSHASPGANVPWITYEAEDMDDTGTVLGPGYAPNTVEAESSGRKCVKLDATGQYVELTAKAQANAIVVRYNVPDSADGAGIDSTVSLYKNVKFVQKLPVTSKFSWLYGGYSFSNTPQALPRNFYDEVRLIGLAINPGDKVRIQKDADDAAAYDVIDLVDLENVAPPLAEPAGGNWLSVIDPPYHAVGDGNTDDTAALQNCINDAVSQGKNVWVPPGNYVLTGDMNNLQNVTIQGAGMWYTTFVGNPAVYQNPGRRVRFNGSGSNVHFNDFAIIGKMNYRNDGEANDGFSEVFGTNSSISRVWVEHTKTGAWIANARGMVISDCRVRDTIADGINLCVGVQDTIVTNCTTRGTGDDCFPIWPATYRSQKYVPGGNVVTHCTGELPFLANGGALYGGIGNRIEDCLFRDTPYGCGVLISGTFPVGTNVFGGTTVVQRCDLIRCGGYDPGYQWRAAFQFTMEHHSMADFVLKDLNIIDSISDGMSIIANEKLTDVSVSNLNIPDFGIGAPGRHGLWAVRNTKGSMNINNSTLVDHRDDSSDFTFNFTNDTFPTNSLPVVPSGLAADRFGSSGNGQVTLNWQTCQFAIGYNIKRAANRGGPYLTIGATSASGYVDWSAPGGPCYYVVSATNAYGESANSGEVAPVPGEAMTITTGTFHDDTVLDLMGDPAAEVYAVGLGKNTPDHKTANGYAFGGYPSDNITYGDGNELAYGGFLGKADSGDNGLNSVLDNAALSQDNNGKVVLKNLTIGNSYDVLFLLMDARKGVGPRAFNITSGPVKTAYQSFAFEAGTPAILGSYALCTFTATNTTQDFVVGANTYLQLNAVLVGTVGKDGKVLSEK